MVRRTRPGISRFSDVQLHIVVRCSASPRNDDPAPVVLLRSPPRLSRSIAVNKGMTLPKNTPIDVSALAKDLRAGSRAALARASTMLESRRGHNQGAAAHVG